MRIIVLGDVLLDINHHCETKRKAPEADIPVYNTLDTKYVLGGAANVANNFKSLGTNVELISIIGNDQMGFKVKTLLEDRQISNKIFIDNTRKTTQKNRIFHKDKLISRYDIEDTHAIDSEITIKIIDYIKSIKDDIDAIVFSDYNKGFLSYQLCEKIISYANEKNILTFVDPKPTEVLKYKNCFLLKCNLLEGELISGKKNRGEILSTLKNMIQCNHVILTGGKDGMYIDDLTNHIEHKCIKKKVDVTGCGDIVLSVLTYIYLKNNDLLYSCKIANFVAGKCVECVGNYLVSASDIDEYIDCVIYDNETSKIESIKKNNNKIVFTNGCFDVIHSAHIRLLQFSKKQGNVLVVGLNSDESIKRLKGNARPINNIQERCELLRNVGIVDYIIIFDDDTPINILKSLRPNVLIKGGDYTKENIIGKEFADEIVIYNYIPGLSSSNTIRKILKINP
jgi:D-beta-D-heptose 7-phosphate kinase/D-beta-D-heptose 1-phosphate adenosyltransferase